VDEDKIRQHRRDQDEQATRQRAAILGVEYIDVRETEQTMELVSDILSVEDMHKYRLVSLASGNEDRPWTFGVTAQTPQSLIQKMVAEYHEAGKEIRFYLISTAALKC
jgi:hypothetical protein